MVNHPITRRSVSAGAGAVFAVALGAKFSNAQETPEVASRTVGAVALRRYIEEVLYGSVDLIDEFIHPNVEFAQAGISGIEQFREKSIEADAGRRQDMESFEYEIQAVFGSDSQALGYALFKSENGPVGSTSRLFWYAELEDGLIREMEAGGSEA